MSPANTTSFPPDKPLFEPPDLAPAKANRSRLASGLLAPIIGLIVAVTVLLSSLAPLLNNRILEWRMAATPVQTSGEVVFVAIDSRSLQEVGTWPWSRSIHAAILDQLVDAGARDIFFDIAFAFESDPAGDADFVAALERAGGATLLATFAQARAIGASDEIGYNLPHPPFRDVSWPAAVNIRPDTDGLVRSYPPGTWIEGEFVPSAATAMTGGLIAEGATLGINFGISPDEITAFSAVDVARGQFPPEQVAGRVVIVGASAMELGDHFAVPQHQVIPGALIHALAAETILTESAVVSARALFLLPVFALLLLALNGFARKSPWRLVSTGVLASVAIEGAALVLFQMTHITLPTAFMHPGLLGFTLTALANSLDLSALLLRRKDLEIRNSQALLSHLFEQSSDGILILDADGAPVMHSRSARAMFGTDETGRVTVPDGMRRLAIDQAGRVDSDVGGAVLHDLTLPGENGARHIEYVSRPSLFQDLDGRDGTETIRPIVAIAARDVTELKQQEREIAYLSTHDERTGALRRLPFLEFLRLRLSQGGGTAVFVLKLHRIKTINLTFGRDVGDGVRAEMVARLQKVDAGLSAIARLDGDTFAFFLEIAPREGGIADLARTIHDRVCDAYAFPDVSAQIGASIGYVELPDGTDIDAVDALSRAEDALDTASLQGQSGIFAYDPGVARQRARIRDVERAMPGSIERGELYVEYQPQHRLSDGALIGFEALVRWKNPELGQIFPDEFIPIAESNGFINDLGRFVLRQAVEDALALPDDVVMAVNVSSLQFRLGDLRHDVHCALSEAGLPPERLCLELTESVLLTQDRETVETMQDIAMTGVQWAMDDFGTGFSSMAYLSILPLSKIKLDQSFTMALDTDPTARIILRSVTALCEGLGIGLLCEGIETQTHLAILLEEGCKEGQGYFYGRPMPLSDVLGYLRSTDEALAVG